MTGTSEPLEYWKDDLESYASSHFSQGGEDGVLLRLFERIGILNRYFVEFGAWDGIHLSNTANLRLNHGWSGLLMEGSDRADGVLVRRERVDAENVEALFRRHGVPESFDLLSIDIDGNDYWVWKAIEKFRPRVVLMEYNIFFALTDAKTMPYNADHLWDDSVYHGASLAALRKLGDEKGYSLVYCESYAPNAFFVDRSELPADWVDVPIEEVTGWNCYDVPPDELNRPWEAV